MTAKAEVRFRLPVAVGTQLTITGRLVERNRKLVRARAEIRTAATDELVAELEGQMYVAAGSAQVLA